MPPSTGYKQRPWTNATGCSRALCVTGNSRTEEEAGKLPAAEAAGSRQLNQAATDLATVPKLLSAGSLGWAAR